MKLVLIHRNLKSKLCFIGGQPEQKNLVSL